jgi:hypothetical protein
VHGIWDALATHSESIENVNKTKVFLIKKQLFMPHSMVYTVLPFRSRSSHRISTAPQAFRRNNSMNSGGYIPGVCGSCDPGA